MGALRDAGLELTSHASELPGCPDIVLERERIAIFVDGDFWHGRQWRRRRSKLAAGHNPEYWIAKIERNMQRDREQARQLRQLGWLVVRVWEGQIAKDRHPEIALLGVLAHRDAPVALTAARTLLAALGDVDEARARWYAEIVLGFLDEAVRLAPGGRDEPREVRIAERVPAAHRRAG